MKTITHQDFLNLADTDWRKKKFNEWLGAKPATKRQVKKFFARYTQIRGTFL